jgi:hypothetical protein
MLKIKFFKKIAKVSWTISLRFSSKYGGLIFAIRQAVAKAEEAFENYLKILSTLRQSNYFKSS